MKSEEDLIFLIYFPDDLLDQMAELQNLPVRILEFNEVVPFKNYAEDIYEAF